MVNVLKSLVISGFFFVTTGLSATNFATLKEISNNLYSTLEKYRKNGDRYLNTKSWLRPRVKVLRDLYDFNHNINKRQTPDFFYTTIVRGLSGYYKKNYDRVDELLETDRTFDYLCTYAYEPKLKFLEKNMENIEQIKSKILAEYQRNQSKRKQFLFALAVKRHCWSEQEVFHKEDSFSKELMRACRNGRNVVRKIGMSIS